MIKREKGVSIIIPIYNAENYIDRCINSLSSQTFFKNLDFIFVVDKNSIDNSELILRNLTKNMNNVQIITPKRGSGAGYNRNVGIKYITKDYFGFHDADDWVDSDFYERLYDYSQIYNADIVVGDTIMQNDENNEIMASFLSSERIEYTVEKAYNFMMFCTVWDKIFRTKVFKNDKKVKFAQDICHEENIFILNAVYKMNKMAGVPGSAYHWMRNPNSVTMNPQNHNKHVKDAYIMLNLILDALSWMDLPLKDKYKVIQHNLDRYAVVALDIPEKGDYLKGRILQITGVNL